MEPFQSDTGTQLSLCSTDQLWHHSAGTWWPREPVSRQIYSLKRPADITPCWVIKLLWQTLILTMYMGEPHRVAAIVFVWRWRANPKSAGGQENKCGMTPSSSLNQHRCYIQFCLHKRSLPILMQVLMGLDLRPSGWQSRMFCGLRSLWRMPLLCRIFMAWEICCRNMWMVSSLNVPLAEGQRDEIHEMILEWICMEVYRLTVRCVRQMMRGDETIGQPKEP